jgi:hypothetical protein
MSETGICNNCNKSFPSEKLDLHDIYCKRNNIKCSKCGEFINKSE